MERGQGSEDEEEEELSRGRNIGGGLRGVKGEVVEMATS